MKKCCVVGLGYIGLPTSIIAASNGFDEGNRKLVEGYMTTSDISEAQRLARECVKKNYIGC